MEIEKLKHYGLKIGDVIELEFETGNCFAIILRTADGDATYAFLSGNYCLELIPMETFLITRKIVSISRIKTGLIIG